MKRIFALAAGAALAGCATAPSTATGPAPAPAAAALPSTPPELGPAPSVNPPTAVRRTLPNGLEVVYIRQDELPVVSAALVTRDAGSAADPAALPGLATFTASMLDEGAAGLGSLELAEAVDALGADLRTAAGADASTVSLYVLRANFPAALQLMADVATRPDFPEREVARLRDERITALARAKDEPGAIAGAAFPALLFGDAHPYGRTITTETAQQLSRERVAAFHAGRYRPERSTLVLVGDVDPQELHPVVESTFGSWRGAAAAGTTVGAPAAPTIPATRIVLVDKPGSAQSIIQIGNPAVARDNPDYHALQVLNTILGGSFTSRLNSLLREEKGWTYGARSSFDMRRGVGPFVAGAAIQTAATDSALVEFFRELNRIRDEPVSQDELERAKRYVALGFPADFETTRAVSGQFADLEVYGIQPSFFDSYVPKIMAVTAEDVQRVARSYIRPDRAVVLVVGDRAKVEGPIRALDLAPVEVREVSEFVR